MLFMAVGISAWSSSTVAHIVAKVAVIAMVAMELMEKVSE
jgi:hypothetical protein